MVVRRARLLGHRLFEYLLQVPANRIGAQALALPQLKLMQEVITLAVFVPFAASIKRTRGERISGSAH